MRNFIIKFYSGDLHTSSNCDDNNLEFTLRSIVRDGGIVKTISEV